jgi:hypothetical protein
MAMLAVQIASAELITLHDHVIDTGSYAITLPNITINEPVSKSDGNATISIEEVSWNSGIGKPNSAIEIFCMKNISDPVITDNHYHVIQQLKDFQNQAPTNSTKVFKPYPGFITTSTDLAEQPTIMYVGQINSSEFIMFITEETPSIAALILRNLKVYPITDKDALTRQKVAEGLQ